MTVPPLLVKPLPRPGRARCLRRQLTLQHPHERHPRLRKDPAVEADLDRGCRYGCWAAQDARLLGAGDEVEGVDAADAAVAVPELHLETFGRSGDVEVEQVPVALDETRCRCKEMVISSSSRVSGMPSCVAMQALVGFPPQHRLQ